MEFHPAANIFPMMTGDDYRALIEDMRQNGQREPITLYDGMILDGRNRYGACLEIGLEPVYREWDGDGDPIDYVLSLNLHRRHLNETQRAVIAYKMANMRRGDNQYTAGSANLQNLPISQTEAAEKLKVSPRTVATVAAVDRAEPELLPAMEAGEMSAHEAEKKTREKKRKEERAAIAESAKEILPSDRWTIYHADIRDWQTEKKYDFIITDPPYPREYLSLYSVLAERALEWLKPGGLLIAMCGQSYLDEIYRVLSDHLDYYWTGCYLLPGQPTPLRQRQVNTSWKPLLIYSAGEYKGKIFGDVFKSDGNDKDFHKWGQSVSGMCSVVSQICLPGQSILDPFCGAGTTGVAALMYGCLFDGVELELENVGISRSRLDDATKT